MSLFRLAFGNFKTSFRNYLTMILSLSFTVLVFFNFQNLIYSDALAYLGRMNQEYITILIQVISLVLGLFMLFFIGYATNVYLTRRKKEIGTYIFMGLTNQRIAKMYMIEVSLLGLSALGLGLGTGIITTKLFQMILMAISGISVAIDFQFAFAPVFFTALVYLVIYGLMVLKGYVNIVRSSVLEMITANKQNEFIRQPAWILILKTIAGMAVLTAGYVYAMIDGGLEVLGYALISVVLVISGIYLLFGGFVPFLFQTLARNKRFLYRNQRNLWINTVIFRIRKNFRTYAMASVLMLCALTVLATSFAMKERYAAMTQFRSTYNYQILSVDPGIAAEVKGVLEATNQIEYGSVGPMIVLDPGAVETQFDQTTYVVVPYSEVQQIAANTDLDFDLPEINDDQVIALVQVHLMSFVSENQEQTVTIAAKEYDEIVADNNPYFGRLQEVFEVYVVSDPEFARLQQSGQVLYTYNYRVTDMADAEQTLRDLDAFVSSRSDETAYVFTDPANNDILWIKVLYSISVFLFLVFILASASILFMKIYNDASEERERFIILAKLGIPGQTMRAAITHELRFAYFAPYLIMAVSSYFSVNALASVMKTNLIHINIISLLSILIIFYSFYRLSIVSYWLTVRLPASIDQ